MAPYPVREPIDIYEVRRRVQFVGGQAGFSRHDCLELALVASELSTNILKYGVRGDIDVRVIRDTERGVGLELVAHDEGPPFRDLESALKDGCDDSGPIDAATLIQRGGLAAGLGAVVRFTHELRVETEPIGKRIIVRRYRAG